MLNPAGEQGNASVEEDNIVGERVEPHILISEVAHVVQRAPSHKAPGIDKLAVELLKSSGDAGIRWLHRIYHAAWSQQRTPTEWQQAVVVLPWKNKGSRRDCT